MRAQKTQQNLNFLHVCVFRMSYFFIDEFQGFLCEYFVRRTEELAKLDCNAC